MDFIKSIIVWITGICYTVILFPVTFITWLLSLPFDRDRILTHWILSYQSLVLTKLLPIWTIKIEGREKIVRGTTYVIISNHQSLIDILLIDSLRYKFKWVSKIENTRVPVLGWYLRMADYITVDRGDEESKAMMLQRSFNFLRRGISVMLFPEGTRSLNNEIGFFKRGAFQLALEANVPILPVLIDGTGSILHKKGWIFRNSKITIHVLDPVHPQSFGTVIPEELALRFNSLFTSELEMLRKKTEPR